MNLPRLYTIIVIRMHHTPCTTKRCHYNFITTVNPYNQLQTLRSAKHTQRENNHNNKIINNFITQFYKR